MSQDQTPILGNRQEEPQQSYMQPDGGFDTQAFLDGLDAIFSAGKARDEAEPYLQQALVDAENAGDDAGLLTVLNETIGFYRSQGRHQENMWMIQRAIELASRMRIEGSDAWTTTLINAATGLRAAKKYDQAEDLYRQALASAAKTLGPKGLGCGGKRLSIEVFSLVVLLGCPQTRGRIDQGGRPGIGPLDAHS